MMKNGTVKFFSEAKGFGFIKVEHEPEIFKTDLKDPVKLYFNTKEFSPKEIANSIKILSDLYSMIGGDELQIIGMRSIEFTDSAVPSKL